MILLSFLKRSFSSNLRQVEVDVEERTQLAAAGITEPVIQQYLAWRRGLLVMVVLVTALTAIVGTLADLDGEEGFTVEDGWEALVTAVGGKVDVEAEEAPRPPTNFARFAVLEDLASLYAMPIAALAALLCWSRPKLSYRFVLAGWLLGFLVPVVFGLCPWSWWGVDETPAETPLERYRDIAEGVGEGLLYLLGLLPIVLSLAPGVQRSCLRLKTLLPGAALPGWFLVALAPFWSLLSLVIFVAVMQITSSPVLLVGVILWTAAPMVYVIWSDDFTRPLASEADFARMRQRQLLVTILNATAVALLVGFLLTQQVMGTRLVGLDADASLLVPIDVVQYFLEFFSRSLFMTVLGADVFLRMTLSMWRHTQAFNATAAAQDHDRTMAALDKVEA